MTRQEIESLVESAYHGLVVVPSGDGTGTNALLLTPPDSMAPSFGDGSRARHVANAVLARITADVVEVPTLTFGLAEEAD